MAILGNCTRSRKYDIYSLRKFMRFPIPCTDFDLDIFSVGERFLFEGTVLKTVEDSRRHQNGCLINECGHCYFSQICRENIYCSPPCSTSSRPDGTSVHFVVDEYQES